MTARARTFKRCEIADIMREASVNGMAAIFRADGEIEVFPAIHRSKHSLRIDTSALSEADKALDKWMEQNEGRNARRT